MSLPQRVFCRTIAFVIAVTVLLPAIPVRADAPVNVREHGATGNGETVDTAAVQASIDATAVSGGGTVYFPAGTYLCGSLHLKSRVALRLDAGATIKGIRDVAAYDAYETLGFENDADKETSFFHHALIWGEDLEDVGIVGPGVIDANFTSRGGPKPIALKRCRFIQIEGIRILNAPNYAISLLGCDNVEIDGVTILNAYCDGIDPDSCRNVRISNCHIESWDDAIVPKTSFSLGERRSCENITVTNCFLATGCNCFKLGTESGGDFKRIAVSNCVMNGMPGKRDANSGISLESVDGANIDGVVISNITMVDVSAPIFIRLGNRGRDMPTPVPGSLRNVSIDNVVATNATFTGSVTGIPGHFVENVSISNLRIAFAGGGPYRPVDEEVPEQIDQYPDMDMFGALPAYAFYCRHVRNLTFSTIDLSLDDGYWRVALNEKGGWEMPQRGKVTTPIANPPVGNALVLEDVHDLRIDGLHAEPSPHGDAIVWMKNVQRAHIAACAAGENTEAFLELHGSDTNRIELTGNAFTGAKTIVRFGDPVKPEVVALSGNTGVH